MTKQCNVLFSLFKLKYKIFIIFPGYYCFFLVWKNVLFMFLSYSFGKPFAALYAATDNRRKGSDGRGRQLLWQAACRGDNRPSRTRHLIRLLRTKVFRFNTATRVFNILVEPRPALQLWEPCILQACLYFLILMGNRYLIHQMDFRKDEKSEVSIA